MSEPSFEYDSTIYDEDGNPVLPALENDGNLEEVKELLTSVIDPIDQKVKVTFDSISETVYKSGCSTQTIDIPEVGSTYQFKIRAKLISENSFLNNGEKVVTSGNKLIQIVKVSQPIINGLDIYAKIGGSNTADPNIDDFESYIDEADIESVWVSTDENQIDVYLDTTDREGATGNVLAMYTNTSAERDYVTRTFDTAQDYTAYDGISFWWKQDAIQSDIYYYLQLLDINGEKVQYEIQINNQSEWEFKNYKFDDFTLQTTGPFDWSQVEKIRFYCYDGDIAGDVYVDDIRLVAASSTSGDNCLVKIYKYNGSGEPTSANTLSDFTQLTFDSGNTEYSFKITSGTIKLYHIPETIGLSTAPLAENDYYAIVVENIDNNSDISIAIGSDSVRPYSSGGLFTSTGSDLTDVINTSMTFITYTTKRVTLREMYCYFDAELKPGYLRVGIVKDDHMTVLLLDKIYPIPGVNLKLPMAGTYLQEDEDIILIVVTEETSESKSGIITIGYTYDTYTLNN